MSVSFYMLGDFFHFYSQRSHLLVDGGSAEGAVVGLAEAAQDGRKVQIFFLHF